MTLLKRFKENQDKIYETLKKKNKDYSGNSDGYENFRLCEQMKLCSTEEGIMVRISDKYSRICNLLKNENQVKDESKIDTLLDMSAYCNILASYIQDKEVRKDGKSNTR